MFWAPRLLLESIFEGRERSVNLVDNRPCRGRLVLAKSNDPTKGAPEESQIVLDVGGVWSKEKKESNQVMSAISQKVHEPRPHTLGICMPDPGGFDVGSLPPVWWFQHFDSCWAPLRKWLDRKKAPTLKEFQLITNQVSGLTSIEKTIAVSAFVAYKNMQC